MHIAAITNKKSNFSIGNCVGLNRLINRGRSDVCMITRAKTNPKGDINKWAGIHQRGTVLRFWEVGVKNGS